jgi:hypothetical protein
MEPHTHTTDLAPAPAEQTRQAAGTFQPTTDTSGLPEFGLKRVAKLKVACMGTACHVLPAAAIPTPYFTYLATAPTSAPAPSLRPSNGSDGRVVSKRRYLGHRARPQLPLF